jgi:hypothetical protein
MKNWRATKSINIHDQALVIDDDTGENIAIAYKMENAPVLAAAPVLLATVKNFIDYIECTGEPEPESALYDVLRDARTVVDELANGR